MEKIIDPNYEPEFHSIRDLLLDMAQERSLEAVLAMITDRLAKRPHIALARLWLVKPGDQCGRCRKKPNCHDQTRCLHLVASGGTPYYHDIDEWSGSNSEARRYPIGFGEVGRIAALGKELRIRNIEEAPGWYRLNYWAMGEGIQGFGGQPLLYKGEILGVIGLYSRIQLNRVKKGHLWLRMVANHAAIAISNARAFEEIKNLKERLELENAYLREELDEVRAFGDIIGQSPELTKILKQIEMVAPTDASVLILGESGTGKELVAGEIHKLSQRRNFPMIRVNCASIPSELYESEFFGHIKGAFTGAVKNRSGRFEAADGGTLLLDEVGEIPLPLQGKFLRVLQEGEYERIGEEKTRKVDVRIIATTNRNLRREVEEGRFRKDLYYRINIFPIELPPLRRRKEDIPLLAEHFLAKVARKMNRSLPRLTRTHLIELKEYNWPGNVRELQNVIERAMITSRNGDLSFDLPYYMSSDRSLYISKKTFGNGRSVKLFTEREIKQKEKENLRAVLINCGWKISGPGGASEFLGVKATTLKARMKKMGLSKPS